MICMHFLAFKTIQSEFFLVVAVIMILFMQIFSKGNEVPKVTPLLKEYKSALQLTILVKITVNLKLLKSVIFSNIIYISPSCATDLGNEM